MLITLIGAPIAKARHRHYSRNHRVIVYDPQQNIKESVNRAISSQIDELINSEDKKTSHEASNLAFANSYSVDLWFYLPCNDSDSIAVRNAKLWGLEQATNKPDVDNLHKFYLDCANGLLWKDDRMIIDLQSHKRYGDPPRVEITVMESKKLNLHPKVAGLLKVFSPTELKEFLQDIRILSNFDPNAIEDLDSVKDRDDKSEWLTAVAAFLSEFAERHSEQLKKCRKFDGLREDLSKIKKCKAALQ